MEFCRRAESGGNRVVVATAAGRSLAKGGTLALRQEELAPVLATFHALPEGERKAVLEDPGKAVPPKRPVPGPPARGLIMRGYCTYLQAAANGRIERARQMYYKENPDAWAAETQDDMLWLTEAECQSLIPGKPKQGLVLEVAPAIRNRFFSTIGIDYMEGSVNALPTTESAMTLTVGEVTPHRIVMALEGYGQMGVPFAGHRKNEARSRGCKLRVSGKVVVNRKRGAFERFDLVGIGRAWGNKMEALQQNLWVNFG